MPPFKVGWTELLEANTRGRWWLVGSAWAGRRAEEQRGAAEKKANPNPNPNPYPNPYPNPNPSPSPNLA